MILGVILDRFFEILEDLGRVFLVFSNSDPALR